MNKLPSIFESYSWRIHELSDQETITKEQLSLHQLLEGWPPPAILETLSIEYFDEQIIPIFSC